MKKPLVSIITPCYNCEEYIGRYLDRIIQQDYPNLQIILVNDGSVDNTEDVILCHKAAIEENNYVFTYVKQNNLGIGGAINTGLKSVRGEYFTWCDSDNFYSNEYVSRNIEVFEMHPEYAVVRCNGNIVREDDIDHVIGSLACDDEAQYCDQAFINCLLVQHFHFGCAMIKTKAFDSVNPSRDIYPSRAGQNWQLLLPVLYSFPSGYFDEKLFYFVYRKNSLSNITQFQSLEDKINKEDEYEKIINNTLDRIEMEQKERNYYKLLIREKYSRRRMYLYLYGNDKEGVWKEFRYLSSIKRTDLKTVLALIRSKFVHLNNYLCNR